MDEAYLLAMIASLQQEVFQLKAEVEALKERQSCAEGSGRSPSAGAFSQGLSKAIGDLAELVEDAGSVDGGVLGGELGNQGDHPIQSAPSVNARNAHVGMQQHAEGVDPSVKAGNLFAKMRSRFGFLIRHRGFSKS